jgi:hypothetical protein
MRATLLSEIKAALGSALSPNLTAASDGSDLFEAYVFGLVLLAARQEGALSIRFENVDQSTPNAFTFRTSPGHLYWDSRPYTHAVIEFPNRPELEVHLGIYVGGKSGVIHEADVAVILRDEAITSRNNQVPPRSSKVILAVECKFYSTNLPLSLARGFVGLCSELTSRDCFFVMNTGSTSVEKLLTHHGKNWENQVFPTSDRVNLLRAAFREAFKHFKTRYS